MNGEEALTRLLHIGNDIRDFCDGAKHMSDEDKKDIEALDYAIAKIEEESRTLDKIRTEIENLPTTKCTETRRIYIDADVFKVNTLAILDKYRAESEG